MYTPTVGEACQKFGKMPMPARGMYISIRDRGNLAAVIKEYAEAEMPKDADGKPVCDCMVFSDGGRILGLGDLGAWGMGIPMGKLDLYTACGGFDPRRTIPVIIDAGIGDASKNTAKIPIRDDELYTGCKQDRVTEKSAAGTVVNSAYYGEDSFIDEFMSAATAQFGSNCLLQFEDFNSNDAFPLLATYREKYLCYNDDIQGTAAVAVAGILGGIKLKYPDATDLIGLLANEHYLFHGAGSANLGGIALLVNEGKVPKENVHITNSRGLIWADTEAEPEGAARGNYRNKEQAAWGYPGEPKFNAKELTSIIENLKPSVLVGAVGVCPGCFDQKVIDAMMTANREHCTGDGGDVQDRPIVFALSNPKSQAEVTAKDAYEWSNGEVIYGSGTQFPPHTVDGREHCPGQVNNVYIFPGMSFGAQACAAKTIPERLFMVAAEAVANSLTEDDMKVDRVIPSRDRLREVNLNVATAVVLECQKLGLATNPLGDDAAAVKAALKAKQWSPSA